MSLRICLLTNQDLDSPTIADDDWPCDPRPFMPEAFWHLAVLGDKVESVRQVQDLIAQGVDGRPFDVFFNLCDGAADQPELPGIEVIQTLEAAGVAYSGATSACYEPTREQMKQVCADIGIAAPPGVVAGCEADIDRALAELSFPMFVKHHNSYASVDLSRHSKVVSEAGLRRQVRKIIRKHGAALIEQYIEGLECTVLVVERPGEPDNPVVYPPVEYAFPPGEHFKHSDMKWVDYGGMRTQVVQDAVLADRLRDEIARFFVAIGCGGFGRCDVRVSADGTPHVLEINANCGVYHAPADYGSADFCIALDPAGHVGFTKLLIEGALVRGRAKLGLAPDSQ